jgi:hypothetical protein
MCDDGALSHEVVSAATEVSGHILAHLPRAEEQR